MGISWPLSRRGYRVTAQSIIPGILEREQEQSVVYGSIDFGKTVLTHPKYLELVSEQDMWAESLYNVNQYKAYKYFNERNKDKNKFLSFFY